ncbi:hypothetical protein GGH99_008304, partial [Coemansia sp. RSA 1285]
YCEQLGSTREDSPADLAYVSLFASVKQMRAKKQRLLSNISGMHSQNSEAIQKISDLEAKKISAERHIRELRLRILMKQAMAENLRRMDNRMVAGQLDMSSAATTSVTAENGLDAPGATEITKAMLRIAIRDTASQVSEGLSSLVPDLAPQTRGIWSSGGGGEKTDQITQT